MKDAPWNHKRVYRVYFALKLNLRRKGKKRLPNRNQEPLAVPEQVNQCWSMDFMSDALFCGRRFRTFNVVDDCNREALPIEGSANTWGDEIYFEIPVSLESASDARADVEIGELGYWPTGRAFCIFFGPTPVSSGDKPRAASPVNVFGRISGDATRFRSVADGDTVRVDKA